MDTWHAQGSIEIDRPVEDVFAFLCHPRGDPAELTPLEDRIAEGGRLEHVGDSYPVIVEIAARQVPYTARCVAHEPPHRLAMRFEGDLQGGQEWTLNLEGSGTRAHLVIKLTPPVWAPRYLREPEAAARWTQTLVQQTLDNVKEALERSQ